MKIYKVAIRISIHEWSFVREYKDGDSGLHVYETSDKNKALKDMEHWKRQRGAEYNLFQHDDLGNLKNLTTGEYVVKTFDGRYVTQEFKQEMKNKPSKLIAWLKTRTN